MSKTRMTKLALAVIGVFALSAGAVSAMPKNEEKRPKSKAPTEDGQCKGSSKPLCWVEERRIVCPGTVDEICILIVPTCICVPGDAYLP